MPGHGKLKTRSRSSLASSSPQIESLPSKREEFFIVSAKIETLSSPLITRSSNQEETVSFESESTEILTSIKQEVSEIETESLPSESILEKTVSRVSGSDESEILPSVKLENFEMESFDSYQKNAVSGQVECSLPIKQENIDCGGIESFSPDISEVEIQVITYSKNVDDHGLCSRDDSATRSKNASSRSSPKESKLKHKKIGKDKGKRKQKQPFSKVGVDLPDKAALIQAEDDGTGHTYGIIEFGREESDEHLKTNCTISKCGRVRKRKSLGNDDHVVHCNPVKEKGRTDVHKAAKFSPLHKQRVVEQNSIINNDSDNKSSESVRVYPNIINFTSLVRFTLTEDDTVAFCQHYRLLPRVIHCPTCGDLLDAKKSASLTQASELIFRCYRSKCNFSVSIRKHTFFEGSKISIRKMLFLIYLFVLEEDMKVAVRETSGPCFGDCTTSVETVQEVYETCRNVCIATIAREEPEQVGGPNNTVEVLVVNCERGLEKNGGWVLAGVCKDTDQCFFKVIESFTEDAVIPAIQERVAKGTTIVTDKWPGYSQLGLLGFQHTVHGLVKGQSSISFGNGWIKNIWASAKHTLPMCVKNDKIEGYLATYQWRRRNRDKKYLYTAFLEDIVKLYPGLIPSSGQPMAESAAKVLCVGLACVDFINVVARFPQEDSDKRGENYYWQRGGNASNMSTVLTLLSTPCHFMGVLGTKGVEASWIVKDFEKYGISTKTCVFKDVQCPVATSILSQETGTRTIIYFPRDQPCLSYEDFENSTQGHLACYSWVHFELTENVSDVCKMMQSVADRGKFCEVSTSRGDDAATCAGSQSRTVISVEIEKPELADADKAMDKADIVFISKDFAKCRGFTDASSAVKGMHYLCKTGAILICAWGEEGAAACLIDGQSQCPCIVTVPAVEGIKVVDSLGAGDSFVAGVVHHMVKQGLHRKEGHADLKFVVEEALHFGCKVAGFKCSIYGYDGIKNLL